MKIVLPKTLCEIDLNYGPIFFLAGPVKGGDDWQAKCCLEIKKHISNFYAVIPIKHYSENHPLMPFRITSKKPDFAYQLNWERHYLDMAADKGCIIFWLPCESKTNPVAGKNPYAMDTRGELGKWRGRLMSNHNLHVVIGAEPDFPGLSQIQRNYSLAANSNFPVYGSLTGTIAAAIKLAS